MFRSQQISLACVLAIACSCFSPSKVFGQEFTHDFQVNTAVAFGFGDLDPFSPNVSFTNEGLSVNVEQPLLGQGSVFFTPEFAFDLTTLRSLEVTARVEPENQSRLTFFVQNSLSSDFYLYEFSQNDFMEDEFVTITSDATPDFITLEETGVLNGNITGFGFTVPFLDTVNSSVYTVQSVRFITAVPEPMGGPWVLLFCSTLGMRRNRR